MGELSIHNSEELLFLYPRPRVVFSLVLTDGSLLRGIGLPLRFSAYTRWSVHIGSFNVTSGSVARIRSLDLGREKDSSTFASMSPSLERGACIRYKCSRISF